MMKRDDFSQLNRDSGRAQTYALPLWRTSIRRALRRPFQYILFVLGIAIGVAMMVSVDLANRSATRAFELSTDAITGRTTHQIVPNGGTPLDEEIYIDLRRRLGYRVAAPVVEGFVSAPDLGDQPFRLLGVDPIAEPPFRSYFSPGEAGTASPGTLIGQGAIPTLLTRPDTVLLLDTVAEGNSLALNDEIELEVGGKNRTVTIVGLLSTEDRANQQALEGLIFADIATVQETLSLEGQLSRIDLILDEQADVERLAAALPETARLESAAAGSNAIQQMTAAFELNLTALSLLALVVGMFLIYNTVTFSVVQRRPLFGVLRCLGVTGRQLFALILWEAVVLSLIGSTIGVGLGILLGRGMVRLITQTITSFYFTVAVNSVTIDPFSLLRGILFGVLAAVVASFFPALEAWRTVPNAGLRRSSLESKIEGWLPWFFLAWFLLGGAGALLLTFRQAGLVVAFAGLFAVLLAFALVTPPITVWLMRRIVPGMQAAFGTIGRMAPRDIVRSLSRTSVAIAALMTAVSVIVGVSIMIGSFRSTVVTWLNQTLQADIYVSPPDFSANSVAGAIEPEIVTELLAWPGVRSAATARITRVFISEFDKEIGLAAVNGDISQGNRPYAWQPPDMDDAEIWEAVKAGEGVLISEPLVLKEGLTYPPEPLTLITGAGPRQFPVLGVIYDYASDQGGIWIGTDIYADLWDDTAVSTIAIFVDEGLSTPEIEGMVDVMESTFAERQTLSFNSNRSLREGSIEIFDRTFAITSALRLLATIVAFIGVLSALMSLQLERARELGVLRATGMTLRQLWQLTLLETGLMGAVAGLLAIPTGYALAWILIYVINVRSFGWTLQMQLQPSYFLQALAVALVAALLAGIYPSYRLGRMVIAGAIRSD